MRIIVKPIYRTARRFKEAHQLLKAMKLIWRNSSLSLVNIIIREVERRIWAKKTLVRLEDAALLNNMPWCGNPALKIGAAVRLARHYKLELHVGTTEGECRAVLDKEHWQRELDGQVCSFDYGTFTHKLPEEVETIYAFGKSVQEAVCQCLLNCKKAGVL